MNYLDPTDRVRWTTWRVTQEARHVELSETALEGLAAQIENGEWPSLEWDSEIHFQDGGALTAQYLLVLDALNFCFWPEPSWEYHRLALSLKESIQRDPGAFDAERLATIDEAGTRTLLGESTDIPMFEQRISRLRELGTVLAARWEGEAANLVRAANGSTVELVRLVTAEIPGFQDHAIYRGRQVYFYKRAQIFVGDLWGAYGGRGLGAFSDIHRLTMFADYRIPQLLRGVGVLRYASRLATIVDLCRELPSGSDMEIEIRATSVHAVERLGAILHERGVERSAVMLDWILWNIGERRAPELQPHHRTQTIYY